ncbi:MAG: hypothetical protein JSR83_10100 [Proteobacteria bacterium]|nr:hypothetical protein [Pseudomonadota bacterium]
MSNNDPSFQNFLKSVRVISQVTEKELAGPLAYLREIDQVFIDWIGEAGKVKPTSAAVLVLNAHASFRAALFLALSGQLMAVFMTLRGALESALYANAIAVKPELGDVWLHRDCDDESRIRCRSEFTATKMFSYLAEEQGAQFSDLVKKGYDLIIDFGAHPNSRTIVSSTGIKERDDTYLLNFVYAHGPHSWELRRALLACAEIGFLVLMTSLIASQGHPQAKTLAERAQASRGGLAEFIAALGFIDPPADA